MRVTVEEQRSFLLDLSQTFQNLCRDAINGPYDDPFFADGLTSIGKEKRLRAVVRNKQLDFVKTIQTEGAQWKIVENSSSDTRCRTRAEALSQVLQLLKQGRGRELPSLPNFLLVTEIFREYSGPWEGLARTHVSEVWQAAKCLLEIILEHIADPVVGDSLLRAWLDPLMDQFLRDAHAKLEELIAVRGKDPITTNHDFRDIVRKMRLDRNKPFLTQRIAELFTQYGGRLQQSQIPLIVSAIYPNVEPDMDTDAAEDLFDNMNAFYEVWYYSSLYIVLSRFEPNVHKVALKLFIDNIPTLVNEVALLAPILNMFCPKVVFKMKPEIVTNIMTESDEKKTEREELTHKKRVLDTGRDICRQYASRKTTGEFDDLARHGDSRNS